MDESFFKKEMVTIPKKKDSVTLRIDHDVLEFFKHQGRGYQTLINAVLKTYAHAKQKKHPKDKHKRS
ncbi:MAG TPA: BrnA antitoxin family protein [Gammaproteobacteria bacterium]|nr:BrnA antitoxin family protein [Gammaproteobacteria bacterium]